MKVKSILVVDDESLILDFLQQGLSEHGFNVETAENLKDALNLIEGQKFDLVISDVIMDDGDGFELLKKVSTDSTPVIVMSGGGKMKAKEYLRMASGLGAYATLEKPFKLDDVVDLISGIE